MDRLTVIEKQDAATDMAALIIPSISSNHDRHSKLQRFMLVNDSATIAVEVPIWLLESDIAALEEIYGMSIVPKQSSARRGRHKPRFITRHIDFLQARNEAIYILDYKPDARIRKPIAQLTIYALALPRPESLRQIIDEIHEDQAACREGIP